MFRLNDGEKLDQGRGKQLFDWCRSQLGSPSPMKRNLDGHEWKMHCTFGNHYEFYFASADDFTMVSLKFGGTT